MITKQELKEFYEWGLNTDFPLKISPKFTGRGRDFETYDVTGYWLKMTRKMVNIRKGFMPDNIYKIHENHEVLYSGYAIMAPGCYIKKHKDPDVYMHKYKRIQLPLDLPDPEDCYMTWEGTQKVYWKEGEAQVWKVMDHIHEGINKSNKPAKFLFMDVKMETEVEID